MICQLQKCNDGTWECEICGWHYAHATDAPPLRNCHKATNKHCELIENGVGLWECAVCGEIAEGSDLPTKECPAATQADAADRHLRRIHKPYAKESP